LDVFDRIIKNGEDGKPFSVFKFKGALSVFYVPKVLVGREKEEERLARILVEGVVEDYLPPMVRVFGGVGCGKTAVVESVLERFEVREEVFRFFMVNLKRCRSVFGAANAILGELGGERVAVNLGLDRVFERIWMLLKDLKGKRERLFVVLVLDEVDAILRDGRYAVSDFFYRFLRYQTYLKDEGLKLCLLTITNDVGCLDEELDGRVKSVWGDERIIFGGYDQRVLEHILEDRVKVAFKPGVVDPGVALSCALRVCEKTGDARKAVDLLRAAGEYANMKKTNVKREYANYALKRIENGWLVDTLNSLSAQVAGVLVIISHLTLNKSKISTRELYNLYEKIEFEGDRYEPPVKVCERRVLDIIKELETLGLINSWNVSKGRGGFGKELKVNSNPQFIIDHYVLNDSGLQVGISQRCESELGYLLSFKKFSLS